MDEDDGLNLVLFHWVGRTFALPSAQVYGLGAVVDGGSSIGDLLGLPEPEAAGGTLTRSTERMLRVIGPHLEKGLRVQEPVLQRHFSARSLYPLPALLAACLHLGCVRALARWDRGEGPMLIPVLDARRLPGSRASDAAPCVADGGGGAGRINP